MAWDASKPATNTPWVSKDFRDQWEALARSVGTANLLADPTFLIWAAGDAAAPTHWTTSGAGVGIARAGTGLGDTNRKVGDFCAKLTSPAGNAVQLIQALLPTAAFTKASFLQNQAVSLGAWVKCSSANAARIAIDDGISVTYSSFHTGDGNWQWLTVAKVIGASGSMLAMRLEVALGTLTAYLSGPTFVLGPIPPAYYQSAPMRHGTLFYKIVGNVATGQDKDRHVFQRPAIIKDVQLEILTAPATQALIVNAKTWDGAAMTSMFSTRPQIAAAANRGGAQPDTTYARRCVTGYFGSGAIPAGGLFAWSVDQVGTGTVGADLWVFIRYLEFARPLEEFLAYNDQN